jgi:hypothetical protein
VTLVFCFDKSVTVTRFASVVQRYNSSFWHLRKLESFWSVISSGCHVFLYECLRLLLLCHFRCCFEGLALIQSHSSPYQVDAASLNTFVGHSLWSFRWSYCWLDLFTWLSPTRGEKERALVSRYFPGPVSRGREAGSDNFSLLANTRDLQDIDDACSNVHKCVPINVLSSNTSK